MDSHEFEQNVRRLARLLWPSGEMGGAEIVDTQERDGIFVTEDCVHLIECTVSRQKAKAQNDLVKLAKLHKKYQTSHPGHAVKCWFITLEEPTAEQRACKKKIKNVHENIFNMMSFSQFETKLIDSLKYLDLRLKHSFGSVFNLYTQSATDDIKYIPVGLNITGVECSNPIFNISNDLLTGKRFILTGDYGLGKSMTMREIFKTMALHRQRNEILKFPIYINLREHQSQQNPAEILERHARNIGFEPASQLVRAWKAGYATLLLDGFDEVSSIGLQGAWRKLRSARWASMTGIRKLISESPGNTGIIIAGREHFFSTDAEKRESLSVSTTWKDIHLDEFGEDQIRTMMNHFKIDANVPEWFPTRPLLLGTLFSGMIKGVNDTEWRLLENPADGWDYLIDKVCEREAKIEVGVSGSNIRSILESLATVARKIDGGLGPIIPDDIKNAFEEECGYSPTDEALVVLQRLPGLGRSADAAEDARMFIDHDFADACRSGDVVRYCHNPNDGNLIQKIAGVQNTLNEVGVSVSCAQLKNCGFDIKMFRAALQAAKRQDDLNVILFDLFSIGKIFEWSPNTDILIEGISISYMNLDDDAPVGEYKFKNCYIEQLEIPSEITDANLPKFHECLLPRIDGCFGARDLPLSRFIDCIYERFSENSSTTDSVLNSSLPVGIKVVITILKKCYFRSGTGREERSLFRGLSPEERQYVPELLQITQKHGFILKSNRGSENIWLPVRKMRSRVGTIISSPLSNGEDMIKEIKRIE